MLKRLWLRLPVIVRAILVAELIVTIGTTPPSLAVIANLRVFPRIPWMIGITAVWLWFFWRYLSGHGWPSGTAEARKRDLRGDPLPMPVWGWALLAGTLGIACTMALGFATVRLSHLPRDAFAAPVNFSGYPIATVVCAIACISATAGVVEEAGFRGFMLSPIQRRHGWTVAILITGFMFFLDHHFSHAYATFAFLPFFLGISAVHGLLVKYSGSIRPSVLLHAVADFFVIPILFGLVGSFSVGPASPTGFDSNFRWSLALMALFAVAAVPAFRRLAAASLANRVS